VKNTALALALFSACCAHAACGKDGLLAFPTPGSVVPLNVRFILEGAGKEQGRVAALADGDPLVLKASDDVVTVKVAKGWVSSMGRTAVTLTPSAALKPNRTYALMLDKRLPGYRLLNESADRLAWRSGEAEDRTAPKYQVKPAVTEGMYRKDSEGLSRYLTLRTQLSEEGPAYVVVSMQRVRGSSVKQVYAVPLLGGEGRLGHDACSGSFSFDDGRAYKISIETYDSAGNKATEKISAIEANAPRPGVL
jgi:hypothetical protein